MTEAITRKREFGEKICQRLHAEIAKLGFAVGDISHYPLYEQASFRLVKDPFTGDFNLAGTWLDDNRRRLGSLQFNSDGTCYAEFDVVRPHPKKSRWFVEAVTAWGRQEELKAEPRLLPMPE